MARRNRRKCGGSDERHPVPERRTTRGITPGTQRPDLLLFCTLVGVLVRLLRRLLGYPLERGAENVAERRAGIGGAVLGDRLLLLGDFKRLDRHLDLVRPAVELDDAPIDLLADRETLRPLLAAIA